MSELVGQNLERYRIERVIGQGSMGTVYEAHDEQQQRRVAVKVMHPHLAAQEGFQRQFLRDMQLLTPLDHPNLVKVYAAGQSERWLYLVMEYLEGGNLKQYLDKHAQEKRFVPLPSVLDYVAQMAVGLHYAHDQAIVHQDVKPDNILLKPLPNGDFQMAVADLKMRELARSALGSEVLQLASALAYMAPEVCEGRPAEVEADVYSLGIILYHLAVGRLPFQPRSLAEAARMHRSVPVPPPTSIRQGLPVELERIIMQCLAKDPAQRYRTAARLARDLQELQIKLQHKYPTSVGIDTDVGFSTAVTFETVATPQTLHTQPELAQDQIGRDRLVIAAANQPTRAMAINKDVFVIGRDLSADVVLESPLISRYHVRVERLSGGRYQVTDLGSTNGAWVGSTRLSANRARPWPPGQFLRLGDFRLLIEPVTNLALTQARVIEAGEARPVHVTAGVEALPAEPTPLNVIAKLTPDRVTVTPGEQQSLQLELLNESGLVDHFLIHVRNIPQEWVTVPDASLEILTDAGRNRGTVTLIFNPPRESSSIAGAYSFEVVVSSVGQPHALPVIVPGRLQVEPFYGFTSDMQPTRLKDNSKRPQLTIANTGNTPQTYTITALDREEALNFILSPSTLALEPGQSATVPILLSPKIRPLFGSTQRYPFEVTVSDGRTDSPPKTHDGELTVNPLFSRRALSLLALLLALCGLGSFCTASQLIALYNRQQAEAAQQATAAFQAELTRTASADPDQDGLLTFEEERLGTDPLLEDTDGDSLSDRVEAKQLGTNPLAFDSDNDTLSDGVEAASACLSPNNRDTDGDTLLDNVDPDPCQPPTPVPPPPPPTG